MITIENTAVKISFSQTDGSIAELTDKNRNIDYVMGNKRIVPFRIDWNNELTCSYESFSFAKKEENESGTGYSLEWQVNAQVKVTASIFVPDNKGEVIFHSKVINDSGVGINALEYPVIAGLQSITPDGGDDYLAHSFATGFKIHNPRLRFQANGDGLRFMPYPEGFSGATMQFFTYYGEGKGGLYFAAYDSEHYSKWLNFYKNELGLLEASFIHGYTDIGPGKGVSANYPVVVKLMSEGNWYEAADEYKKWAVQQKWTRKGRLSQADDGHKAKWLLEDIGLSTFGMNAGYDRTAWIETYHRLIDTRIFHVLGPDWPQTGQNYYDHVPGGMEDWFPAKFSKENIETFRRFGDKFAPFEFDYLFNFQGADGENGQQSKHMIPPSKSIDKYPFPFICPAAPYTQELHVKRDERLAVEEGVDSIYYDISANNILKVCLDPAHGHPVGAGPLITQAYHDNYKQTKDAMIQASGKYIPMGTEMINEVFVDVLDYYQTRAGAQPATDFEGWNIRELLKTGEAELIPMFTYVYHEYGPVRLDGWGNLTEEIGSLFYFTAARTYLWGGLYELNYEYCPMEVVEGRENPADEHYYRFEKRGYALAPERGEYLRQFAQLRTGRGNKYLAYGTMLRPLPFDNESVALDWFHYNSGINTKAYNDKGRLSLPSILHSAWSYQEQSLGFFFANVKDEDRIVEITIDAADYALTGKHFVVELLNCLSEAPEKLGEIGAQEKIELKITVPAKQVIMLEVHE